MRKISSRQAVQAGWIRYKNKAGMYTAFTLFSVIVSIIVATVAARIGGLFAFNTFIQTTVIAILAGIVSGLLNVGFAHFARKDQAGEDVEFGHFLDGFRFNVNRMGEANSGTQTTLDNSECRLLLEKKKKRKRLHVLYMTLILKTIRSEKE